MAVDNLGVKALRFGAYGGLALGGVMTLVSYLRYGLEDPVHYVGSGSVVLIGAAFWLFMKNAEAGQDERQKDQGDNV